MLPATITGKGILPLEEATKALEMGLIRVRMSAEADIWSP